MKIKFLLIVLLFTIQLLPQSRSVSKVGTTAAAFLEIGPGAPASALGGAFVSVANDATALYWNAAGTALFTKNELAIFHANWIADTKFDYAGLVIPLSGIGSIGLSFTSLSIGDEKVRTVEMPEGTGEFYNASDIAMGLSYAMSLTDRFSIGLTLKYIQQSIWHESASALALDAGTIFRTDLLNGLVIGASISNFGTKMRMDGRDTRSFGRVDENNMGSNERVPFNIEMDSWDLPLLFQIGVSTNVIKTEDFRVLASLDALHPSNNYESLNAGVELAYKEFLFVRGGFRNILLQDAEGGLSFGIGLNSKLLFTEDFVRFDYAYRDFGRLKNVHMLSVDLKF